MTLLAIAIRVETGLDHSVYPGQPGHVNILSGSSGFDPVYIISGFDPIDWLIDWMIDWLIDW